MLSSYKVTLSTLFNSEICPSHHHPSGALKSSFPVFLVLRDLALSLTPNSLSLLYADCWKVQLLSQALEKLVCLPAVIPLYDFPHSKQFVSLY